MKERIRNNTIIFLLFIGSFFTLYNIQEAKQSKDTIKELKKEINYQETKLSETLNSQTFTTGNRDISEPSTITTETTCNIIFNETFLVNGAVDISAEEGIFYRLDNSKIHYDSASKNNIIEDCFISCLENSKKTQTNQVFETNDTNRIIFSEEPINEEFSLAILKTEDENENLDIEALFERVFQSEENSKYTIGGLPISDTFTERVTISEETVTFYNQNDNKVVFMEYQNPIDENYFTEKITIGDCSIKYGSTINEADNLVFYVLEQETPLLMVVDKNVPVETIFASS